MPFNSDQRAVALAVWVDSCIGMPYKYKKRLIEAACVADAFERELSALPAEIRAMLPRGVGDEYEFLKQKQIAALPLWDERYPAKLKHLSNPPLILYARGNVSLLGECSLAVVGSRKIPKDARALARKITEQLASRFVIVTGIAEGGDKAAIEASLESGRLICVLPLGFGSIELSAERETVEKIAGRGLVITERAYRAVYENGVYPMRNRIIAALVDGVLITAAAAKSGALITAECALELGRDVFAFPYSPSVSAGEGCNALIKAGAGLVTCAGDIFDAFHFTDYTNDDDDKLTEQEKTVVLAVREAEHLSAEQLSAATGIGFAELLPMLSMLELKGNLVRMSDGRYKAV